MNNDDIENEIFHFRREINKIWRNIRILAVGMGLIALSVVLTNHSIMSW